MLLRVPLSDKYGTRSLRCMQQRKHTLALQLHNNDGMRRSALQVGAQQPRGGCRGAAVVLSAAGGGKGAAVGIPLKPREGPAPKNLVLIGGRCELCRTPQCSFD